MHDVISVSTNEIDTDHSVLNTWSTTAASEIQNGKLLQEMLPYACKEKQGHNVLEKIQLIKFLYKISQGCAELEYIVKEMPLAICICIPIWFSTSQVKDQIV